MTVRDSRTQARARTPGAEDDPTSTTVRDRALGPTQCGISDVATKGHEGRTQTKYLPVYAGSSLKLAMFGKAPSEMSALQPYRGKPAVRNDRGDRGNVGIIEARSAPRSYPTAGGAMKIASLPLQRREFITLLGGALWGNAAMAMTLKSPAFQQNGHIPSKYTCEGEDVSPPLAWEGAPNGAVCRPSALVGQNELIA